MSAAKCYVLDTNVFIHAHRMHYAFDICPGFWDAMIGQHRLGALCSIDRVKKELAGEDILAEWTKKIAPEEFFRGTADQEVVDAFGKMVRWAQAEAQFTAQAKAEFASVADGWLVAFAKVHGQTVVTQEVYARETKKSVKIPNACVKFGVDYCNTFDMLRGLKEQFVLKGRRKRR